MLDNDLGIIKVIIKRDLNVIEEGDYEYLKLRKNRDSFIKTLDLARENLWSIEGSRIKDLNYTYRILNSILYRVENLDIFEYIEEDISNKFDLQDIYEWIKLYRVGFIVDDKYQDCYDEFEESIEDYEYTTLLAKAIYKIILAIKQVNEIINNTNNCKIESLLESFENELEYYKDMFLDYGLDSTKEDTKLGSIDSSFNYLLSYFEDSKKDKRVTIHLIKNEVEKQLLDIKELLNKNIIGFGDLIEEIREVVDSIDVDNLVLDILEHNGIEADYDDLNSYDEKKKNDRERNRMRRRASNGKTFKQNERLERIEKAKEYKEMGLSEKEIAEKLNVNTRTIKRYLSMDKKRSQ